MTMLADRLRIEGTGAARTTHVYLDGELIEGVHSVTWNIDIKRPITTVMLELVGRPEIHIEPVCPECGLPLPGPHRGTCSQSVMRGGSGVGAGLRGESADESRSG